MSREYIIKIIKPILKNHGVTKASFFGSYARGDYRDDSDLDLLVEFVNDKNLFDLIELKDVIEKAVNIKVDILTFRSLNKYLKDIILKQRKVIYE